MTKFVNSIGRSWEGRCLNEVSRNPRYLDSLKAVFFLPELPGKTSAFYLRSVSNRIDIYVLVPSLIFFQGCPSPTHHVRMSYTVSESLSWPWFVYSKSDPNQFIGVFSKTLCLNVTKMSSSIKYLTSPDLRFNLSNQKVDQILVRKKYQRETLYWVNPQTKLEYDGALSSASIYLMLFYLPSPFWWCLQ